MFTAAGEPVPVPLKANWSAAAIRPVPPNAFCKLRVAPLGVLVTVQTMASPLTGVTLIGRVVKLVTAVGPVLVQATVWLYCVNAEALPGAMASVSE